VAQQFFRRAGHGYGGVGVRVGLREAGRGVAVRGRRVGEGSACVGGGVPFSS
jgi:hypothetical protein